MLKCVMRQSHDIAVSNDVKRLVEQNRGLLRRLVQVAGAYLILQLRFHVLLEYMTMYLQYQRSRVLPSSSPSKPDK